MMISGLRCAIKNKLGRKGMLSLEQIIILVITLVAIVFFTLAVVKIVNFG
jgi:uncharacterized Rmd1/YagE family protein